VFGDYELLEVIAHGGMGIVYRARQKSLDRVVAVKMLLAGEFAQPKYLERFRAEAEAVAQLQHPNIVAIYEVGEQDGHHFFSMECVEGKNLAQLSAELGARRLEFTRFARWLKVMAEAVHYAHGKGIIHRDLKPSNVLIDSFDHPRITDFGLAKRLTGDSDLTLTGQVLGSPNYLPPEQAAGKPAGVESDVYALGAILYHLLTGRPPFQAESLTPLLQQVVEAEPVSPRLLNPGIPRDLETISLKCLEKEPGKRYPAAHVLAEELGRFLEGKPVLARPVSRVAKTWRWCRRNPRLTTAVGLAVMSLLVGLAGVTWQWKRAKAGELQARQNAYAADLNLVQAALEKGDIGGALEVLNRQRPSPGQKDLRGWEWRYSWQRCQSNGFLLCKYPSRVGGLSFSADGKWLALRRADGAVTLWDAVSRRSVVELSGTGHVRAMALSPAGDLLAYGNLDTNGAPITSLYGLAEQRSLAPFESSSVVVHCAFSPDGNLLATWAEDGVVCLRQMEPPRVVTNLQAAKPQLGYGELLFSPSGEYLAVGQPNDILLWEWASEKQRRIPAPNIGELVRSLALSPDGRLLAAAGSRIQIWDVSKVWSLPQGREVPMVGQSDQFPGYIIEIAFSPDGKTLATAETDPRVGLWDAETLKEIRRFQGNPRDVRAVAFSPDGRTLFSGGGDGSVRYFDPRSPLSPEVLPIPVWSPAFTFAPDSQQFIALDSRNGAAELWRIPPGRQIERSEHLSFLGTNNLAVAWSPDGRLLAIGDRAGNLRVWDYERRRVITNFANPGFEAVVVRFFGGGRTLMCGLVNSSGRRDARYWDTRTWREIQQPPDSIRPNGKWPAVSADNRILAVLYGDGTVAWWDIRSRKRLAQFERHFAGNEGYLAFSPVGPLLAGSANDGSTTIWDSATGGIVTTMRANFRAVWGVAFSPDGQRLLSGGEDPKDVVRLLDLGSLRHVATLAGPPDRSDQFWFLEMTADGNTLAAVGANGTALLWRAPSWEEIAAAEEEPKAP